MFGFGSLTPWYGCFADSAPQWEGQPPFVDVVNRRIDLFVRMSFGSSRAVGSG